jgi:hypothetical protein
VLALAAVAVTAAVVVTAATNHEFLVAIGLAHEPGEGLPFSRASARR